MQQPRLRFETVTPAVTPRAPLSSSAMGLPNHVPPLLLALFATAHGETQTRKLSRDFPRQLSSPQPLGVRLRVIPSPRRISPAPRSTAQANRPEGPTARRTSGHGL